MTVRLERVQYGYYLVDCSECGTLGVWETRHRAGQARSEHVCGEPSTSPGRVKTQIIIGGPVVGQ